MAALFDEIQERLRKQQQSLAAGSAVPAGTQAGLAAAARAGTGRATAGGTPRTSNVAEQVAQGAAGAQSAQLASRVGAAADRLALGAEATRAAADAGAAKLAANQAGFDAQLGAQAASRATTRAAATESFQTNLAGQEARSTQAATQRFQQQVADQTSATRNAQDDLFANFRHSTQELAFRKDAAQLEQAAQQMALQDRKYVDELQRIGTLRRLDDENNWRTEMQRLTLGDKMTSALDSVGFKVDLNANQREFDEQMARMNADAAMAIMLSKIQGANAGEIVQGVGGLAKTGASAYKDANKNTAGDSETSEALPE